MFGNQRKISLYLKKKEFSNLNKSSSNQRSAGCIIYEMLTGLPPFYDNNRDYLFQNILKSQLIFPVYISEKAKDLLKKVLLVIKVTLQKYLSEAGSQRRDEGNLGTSLFRRNRMGFGL